MKNQKNKKSKMQQLFIFPCGANGLEALDCLTDDTHFLGFIDDDKEKQGNNIFNNDKNSTLNFKVFDRDFYKNSYKEILEKYNNVKVLACLGSPTNFRKRKEIIESFCKDLKIEKHQLTTIIHPSAQISKYASIGSNCLIMAGVVITHNAEIGDNVMILPNSVIHHDTQIGDFTCIGANVVIAGNVKIGNSCYIGSGATILQNIQIGTKTMIGLSAVIIRNIGENKTVVGNPAREI